jgi:hypothetical protein
MTPANAPAVIPAAAPGVKPLLGTPLLLLPLRFASFIVDADVAYVAENAWVSVLDVAYFV